MSGQNYAYLFAILIAATVFSNNINAKVHGDRHRHAKYRSALYHSKHSHTSHPTGLSESKLDSRDSGSFGYGNSLTGVKPSHSSHVAFDSVHKPPKLTSTTENSSAVFSSIEQWASTIRKTRSYPTSIGLSGSKNTSYPYHSSNSKSGRGNRNTSASYPPTNGLSGGRRPLNSTGSEGKKPKPQFYPVSPKPKPDRKKPTTHRPKTTTTRRTVRNSKVNLELQKVHDRLLYHYSPPNVISYGSSHGTANHYPVYKGHYIPAYVYEYRSSKSKYCQLLTGLALYNLGSVSRSKSKLSYHKKYVRKPDEICMFGVQYKSGKNDKMSIDCKAITSFILAEELSKKSKTIVNQTIIINHIMFPNGTIIPGQIVNQTMIASNFTSNAKKLNGTLVPATAANATRKTQKPMPPQTLLPNGTSINQFSDSKFYGPSVNVKSGIKCYVMQITKSSEMKRSVACGLLEAYTLQSLHNIVNSANVLKPSITVTLGVLGCLILLLLIYVSYKIYMKKMEQNDES